MEIAFFIVLLIWALGGIKFTRSNSGAAPKQYFEKMARRPRSLMH